MEEAKNSAPQLKKVTLTQSKLLFFCLLLSLIFQLLIGYLFFRNSYLSGDTNATFDNIMIRSGAWRMFGEKEYGGSSFNEEYHLDPELYFVKSSDLVTYADGFLHSVIEEGNSYKVEVRKADQDSVTILIDKNELLSICNKNECFDQMSILEIPIGSKIFVSKTFNNDGKNIGYLLFEEIGGENADQ